ncbi:tetratricopeptide repeat protein [Candidatus Uabimicrobium sp. HlEnr_7]|uniref:tetratricopeptide repeat protein n=1 Tax=Candidatus Uabimicrobium helgolandensis TaxID=3095367 RepID=UPI00355858BD
MIKYHSSVLALQHDLASFYQSQGNYNSAEQLLVETVEFISKVLTTMINCLQKNYEEAKKISS